MRAQAKEKHYLATRFSPEAIRHALDRLLHHCHVVHTDGDSLRLKEATAGKGAIHLQD